MCYRLRLMIKCKILIEMNFYFLFVLCAVEVTAGRIEPGGGSRIMFINSKAAGTQEVDWQEAFRDHRQEAGTGSRDVAVTGVTRQRMARNARQPGWHQDPARMAKRTTAGCGREYLPEGGAGSRMPPYQDDAGTARWNGKGKTREASGQGMQGAIRFKEQTDDTLKGSQSLAALFSCYFSSPAVRVVEAATLVLSACANV